MTEKIEKGHGSTDIIFITGYASLRGGAEGQLDEKEMLMKPIEPGSLLEKASKRLARVH